MDVFAVTFNKVVFVSTTQLRKHFVSRSSALVVGPKNYGGALECRGHAHAWPQYSQTGPISFQ
jgi:hypothetical protein